MKRVPRENVKKQAIEGMILEIKMMSKLHHPNVIQFLACCFEPFVCLVLELAPKGSLKALLSGNTFTFE